MESAVLLLIAIGCLGAFDIAYFHTYRAKLVLCRDSRREAWIHVVRGFVYGAQFLVVPNLRLSGAWYAAFVALFALDIAVAVADVLEEPRSRAPQGGLSPHEYLIHVVLSVLVGAFLSQLVVHTHDWWREPTAISLRTDTAPALRVVAAVMAAGSFFVSLVEAGVLVGRGLGNPRPLHIRVRLQAPLERVWGVTQDHRLHPGWDYRFSRITMLHEKDGGRHAAPLGTPDTRIATGTVMRYETDLLGLTIRGFGKYKLHRPMRQSTFEFWSDDPRSLIRRGVGLWLYRSLGDGRVELATSFDYEVRWGVLGRVVDRAVFRPVFQRLTEASFARLARLHFADPNARVLGRVGRRPERFQEAA